MEQPLALVVDDEKDIRDLLKLTLSRMQVEVIDAETIASAKRQLTTRSLTFCLTDMRLPDGNGVELVEYIQQNFPSVPVAVITAFGNMESAIVALKAGAFDFVVKPIELNVLRDLVNTALKIAKHIRIRPNIVSQLLGCSPAIAALRTKINKLAHSQAPVQINGASGVGKEIVARMIHEQGPWSDKPFVAVNCGAIPSELMESEFFGHKRGSFTGAVSDNEGLFQAAAGGTLFLDEVAELPVAMQVKLLRAIQEKRIRPVGGQKEIPVEVRILSATHQDLRALLVSGKFRQDLFYRINVIELKVPSLAERPEDIPLLVEHMLTKLSVAHGVAQRSLSREALLALCAYSFPGNIRELENILERAFTLSESKVIQAIDLHLPAKNEQHTMNSGAQNLDNYLDDVAKQQIMDALEKTRWNKTSAAKLLGISFRALRYRLEKLGIE